MYTPPLNKTVDYLEFDTVFIIICCINKFCDVRYTSINVAVQVGLVVMPNNFLMIKLRDYTVHSQRTNQMLYYKPL